MTGATLLTVSVDLCEAGRRVRRGDDKGGLDWRTPCPRLVAEDYRYDLTGAGQGKIGFCAPHGELVADDLYDSVGCGSDRLS